MSTPGGPTVLVDLRALAVAVVPLAAVEHTLTELAAEAARALAAAHDAAGPGRLADALDLLDASVAGRAGERADECRVLARALRETVAHYREDEAGTARLVRRGDGGEVGDPAAVAAAAARLRRAAGGVTTALEQLARARDAARAGWTGPAAGSFDAAMRSAEARTASLARLADAAEPLEAYAADLQAARETVATNERRAVGTPDAEAALVVDRTWETADDAARAAADRAATGVERTAAGLVDGFTTAQSVRTAAGTAVGQGLGAVQAHLGVVAARSSDVLDLDGAAAARTGAGTASGAGSVLGVLGAGTTQWLRDADDPQYSDAERAGRAGTAAVTVGGGSVLGAVAAGAVVGSVVPVGGTIVGALTGLAVGAVGGLVGGAVADAVDDGAVDAGGDLAAGLAGEDDDAG